MTNPAIGPFLLAVGFTCLALLLLVSGWDMLVAWWRQTRVYRWIEFRRTVGKPGRRDI
jgi:hypothetical protein